MGRFSGVFEFLPWVVVAAVAACGGSGDDFQVPPGTGRDAGHDAAANDAGARDALASDASRSAADLSVTMTAAPEPVNAGSTLEYTIVVANAGGLDATNVKVVQQLPAGNVAFASATGIGWACSALGQIVTCTRATAIVGTAPTIFVDVTTPATGGSLASSVTVSADTADTDHSNNTAATASTVVAPADLAIAITAPNPVAASSSVTYAVTVTNAGPSDAQGITVVDTLPSGATFVSAAGTDWTCALANGKVTCTLATLPTGPANVIDIVVTAPSVDATLVDSAAVSATTNDPNASNDTASITTTVNAPADLELKLTASPDPVAAQSTLTYTLDVTNHGAASATQLKVVNTLPDGNVAFQSASGIGWTCAADGQVVTCTRALLIVGAAPTITIKITTPQAFTALTDSATVSAQTADSDSSNNSQSITTAGATPLANLAIALTDTPDPVARGGDVLYVTSVHNAGPATATGLSVVLSLPISGTFTSVQGSGWVCPAPVGGSITCTRSTGLASGADAPTIDLHWLAPSPGGFSIVCGAEVKSTTTDPDLTDNTTSNDTTVQP